MSRFGSVKFDDKSIEAASRITELAEQLEAVLLQLPGGRYQSLALTALEEALMWANKAIRDGQLARTTPAAPKAATAPAATAPKK